MAVDALKAVGERNTDDLPSALAETTACGFDAVNEVAVKAIAIKRLRQSIDKQHPIHVEETPPLTPVQKSQTADPPH